MSKKKGRAFGKVSVGPVSGYFGGSPNTPAAKQDSQATVEKEQHSIGSDDGAAIEAFGLDRQFLNRLRDYGVPWRGAQERLKEELPERLIDRDDIAYRLVPKAMDAYVSFLSLSVP